ncbi:MAG TPA: hypothetical protein VFN35_36145 [Ktedonobacteraceae bacterium]|nr:hypothetical protein [Ktedonobacteraceae bacterium]
MVSLAPTDIARYECYGLAFWRGSQGIALLPSTQCSFLLSSAPFPALHALPQEYPPLTVLLFSLPLLTPLPYYALIFALLMTLVALGLYRLLARSGASEAAPIFLFYLVLGTGAVVQERFDLLPAACTLICLLAAERGHWRVAYLALALGVLLKLYPILLLPALFLAEQHSYREQPASAEKPTKKRFRIWQRSQNCLLFAVICIGIMGGFALINYSDALISPLRYFLQRPFQIEALASSLLWLGKFSGVPYTINFDFGSLNIQSGLAQFISPLCTLFAIIGTLVALWLQWSRRIELATSMVGLICVLLVTGKVFSPQYLIWLFPLLAYISARRKTTRLEMLGWLLVSVLTTFIYVVYYSQLAHPESAAATVQTLPGFFEMVALRNLLLLVTVLCFLLRNSLARKPEEDTEKTSFISEHAKVS